MTSDQERQLFTGFILPEESTAIAMNTLFFNCVYYWMQHRFHLPKPLGTALLFAKRMQQWAETLPCTKDPRRRLWFVTSDYPTRLSYDELHPTWVPNNPFYSHVFMIEADPLIKELLHLEPKL